MGTDFSLKRLDALEAKVQRAEFIREKYPAIADIANCDVWFSCMYMMQMALRDLSGSELVIAIDIITITQHNCASISIFNINSFKQKIWYLLSKLNFKFTCKLRNFMNIGF